MKKLTVNYHTHTYRCNHAGGTDREYVEHAIANGIKVLGFADHTPMIFPDGHQNNAKMTLSQTDDYFRSVLDLRDEYKNEIEIHAGFEFEYFPSTIEATLEFLSDYPLEYLIMGQHYIWEESRNTCSFDYTDDAKRLASYYDCVREGVKTGLFMYIAHPDVIHFTGSDTEYEAVTRPFLEDMKKADIPLEINVKGIQEPEYKKYPEPLFWKLAGKIGNKAIIGLDAHEPDVFDDCISIGKAFAFAEKFNVNLLDNPGFPVKDNYKPKF